MSEFLKGNFKVKKEVKEKAAEAEAPQTITDELRAAALHTIGGSMVYMERTKLTWEKNDPKK